MRVVRRVFAKSVEIIGKDPASSSSKCVNKTRHHKVETRSQNGIVVPENVFDSTKGNIATTLYTHEPMTVNGN